MLLLIALSMWIHAQLVINGSSVCLRQQQLEKVDYCSPLSCSYVVCDLQIRNPHFIIHILPIHSLTKQKPLNVWRSINLQWKHIDFTLQLKPAIGLSQLKAAAGLSQHVFHTLLLCVLIFQSLEDVFLFLCEKDQSKVGEDIQQSTDATLCDTEAPSAATTTATTPLLVCTRTHYATRGIHSN